jgi:hypothetical protein
MVLNDAKSQPVTRCWTTEVEKTKEMLTILMSHPNYEAVEDGVIGKAWARDGEDGVLIGIFLMPMQIFGQIVFI